MTDDADLLPCPFCGAAAASYADSYEYATGWTISCKSLDCYTEPRVWAVYRSTAEMQWNSRPAPAQATARLVEAARRVNHDNIHGNGLEGFREGRESLLLALKTYDAAKETKE